MKISKKRNFFSEKWAFGYSHCHIQLEKRKISSESMLCHTFHFMKFRTNSTRSFCVQCVACRDCEHYFVVTVVVVVVVPTSPKPLVDLLNKYVQCVRDEANAQRERETVYMWQLSRARPGHKRFGCFLSFIHHICKLNKHIGIKMKWKNCKRSKVCMHCILQKTRTHTYTVCTQNERANE